MKALHGISFVLLVIGGLNWLLVGLFTFDLVAWIFGSSTNIVSRIVYILVGLSAIYLIFAQKRGSSPAVAPQM